MVKEVLSLHSTEIYTSEQEGMRNELRKKEYG